MKSASDAIGKYLERLESPEYQAEVAKRAAEEEERQRLLAEQEERRRNSPEAKRRRFAGYGIPGKDIARLIAGELSDTGPLRHAREFLDGDSVSLVVGGPRGCGKTVAASWAVSQGVAPLLGWQGCGAPLFVDVSRLARVSRYSNDEMDELENASLLAIDDLGMEYNDAKGAFLATLDGLFNARYSNCRRTLITTNLTASRFRERYGERIADRIRESGRFVEIAGESMRGRVAK
jgi:DNA replication protein DnaC